MERKIEFRGKCLHSNEWVHGDLIQYQSGECAIMPTDGWRGYGYEASDCLHREKVIPETVGQFTGFTDCNGTPIYEGDILRHRDTITLFDDLFEVRWHPSFSGFYCVCVDGSKIGMEDDVDGFYDFTVVGNIHDNPISTKDKK